MAGFAGVRDPNVEVSSAEFDELDLAGKRAAVVGGTGGIGRGLALAMAERGAEVTVVGRTFRDVGVAGIRFVEADLSTIGAARGAAKALQAEVLDLLVFTTGIMPGPEREETAEGLEVDLAISYLSRLAILRDLAPRLGVDRNRAESKPRVFVMGYPGTDSEGDLDDFNSERSYKPMVAHMNTVAGNEALVLDAAERYSHLNVYGLNPGLIRSDIRANMLGGAGSLRHRVVEGLIGLLRPSAEAYARRMVPILFSPDLESHTAIHFNHKGLPIRRSEVMTDERVYRYMEASEALLRRVPVG